MTSEHAARHAKVAALARHRPADDPELLDAKRELRVGKLAEHIRRVVDEAPPLTADQRTKLAMLLATEGAEDERTA